MNREIKFRGKRVNGGEWVYGMTISNGTIKRKINNIFFEVAENKWVGVLPETLGQYTGLKDKDGKEIYEGDIVKGVSHKSDSCISELIPFDVIGVVGYHKEYQTLEVSTKQASLHIEVAIKGEVIGNIHDNPELMKGGSNEA